MGGGVSAPGRDNTAVRTLVGFDWGLFAKPTASSVVHVLVETSRTFQYVFGLLPNSCSTYHLELGLHFEYVSMMILKLVVPFRE